VCVGENIILFCPTLFTYAHRCHRHTWHKFWVMALCNLAVWEAGPAREISDTDRKLSPPTDRDSWVGIATRYGLDGPGIESPPGEGGEIFRTRPDRPWGPPSPSYTMGTGSFPVVKRPGRGVDHPPPSSAEVIERVELYLYSPSGLSWPVLA